MRLLPVSDRESEYLWDSYQPGRLADVDLILLCGDLNAHYLPFLVTMGAVPLLYAHGNHDRHYVRTPAFLRKAHYICPGRFGANISNRRPGRAITSTMPTASAMAT